MPTTPAPSCVACRLPFARPAGRHMRLVAQSGTTAVAWISTLARSSTSAMTCTAVMAGKCAPHDLAIDSADLGEPPDIFALVHEVPDEIGHVFRPRVVAGEHGDDVAQRLRDLVDEVVAFEAALARSSRSGLRRGRCARAPKFRWRSRSASPSLPAGAGDGGEGPSSSHPASPGLQEFARDDQLLHFGRALVDAQRPDLAIEALDDLAALDAAVRRTSALRDRSRTAPISVAVIFAIAASRVVGSFCTSRRQAAR